jgi:tetratricopeptide (TPR) repeat protein
MRNRYLVCVATALIAVVLTGATGCKGNPETAKKKYLESGLKYVDKKQYDAAVIQFKKALQVDPNFADAHYQLGMTYLRQGNDQQHVQAGFLELRAAANKDPKNLKARLEMGNLLWASRRYKDAEEQANKVIEADPNNADAYSLLGTTLFAEKNADGALQAYNKVIELKPNDSGAYLNRGVLYTSMKKDAEAEADFQKAISLNPKNQEAYANLSRFYLYKQDPAKAEQVLQEGIKNDPDSPGNYLRLAGLLLQEKRLADAETVVTNLRNRLPKNTDVAGAIAEFYMAARNPDAAIKEYQRGLSIDPKNERLTLALAETYLMTGHVEEVTKLDDQILKDKPNDVPGRMIKGRLQAIKGDYPSAVTTFRGVVKDSAAAAKDRPDQIRTNAQAHYFLGQALMKTGDMTGAKSEFQEAITLEPDTALYLQAQAEAYRDSRDFATAKEFADRLLKMNDKNPQAHFLLASIDLGAKDYQAALEELAIVAQAAPNDPSVHLNMAFAYGGLKKFPEAEREFQTAMKLNPQYDGAVQEYIAMLFGTNQAAKALQVANQYETANPSRAAAAFVYASALANAKKYDEAVPFYQKAIQLDPKGLMSYMQLGRVYELQGKTDDALGIYQKALTVAPDSPGIIGAIGNVYLSKNDLQSAQKYYEKANTLAPHDALIQNNLAWVYAVQGKNLDVALSLATQAKQAAPSVASINDTLGWIQYKKGNYVMAVGLLNEVVKEVPQSSEYRYHLGMALNGAGQRDRAKEELKRALQLAPPLSNDDTRQAQDTLAKL